MKPGDMIMCVFRSYVFDRQYDKAHDNSRKSNVISNINDRVLLIAVLSSSPYRKDEILVLTESGRLGWTWSDFFTELES